MTGLILQFGTSRFLQAHVDMFAHEAAMAGQAVPPIVVVQLSGSAARAGRVAAFGRPEGYPVIVRGLDDGAPVERTVTVHSVREGLSASRDWPRIERLFVEEAGWIVSNTGDSGYAIADSDRAIALADGVLPVSFPARLAVLLHARFQSHGRPITILPCELVSGNGTVLHRIVADWARGAGASEAFLCWLDTLVIWANTLVDRIVSEPIEPIGAVAEPYALWAIEECSGLQLPFAHPAVQRAGDLEPFERLKLHILNLTHSVLAQMWLDAGGDETVTVCAMLKDPATAASIDRLHAEEIIPGFAARGMEGDARTYLHTTMQRLRNPFLDHRVADIAQSHATKVERRIAAFVQWVANADVDTPPSMPRLTAMAAGYL